MKQIITKREFFNWFYNSSFYYHFYYKHTKKHKQDLQDVYNQVMKCRMRSIGK